MAMTMQEIDEDEARAIFLEDDSEEESGGAPRATLPFGRGALALAALLAMAGVVTLALDHTRASPAAFLGGSAAQSPVVGMVAVTRIAGFETQGVDPCEGLPFLKLLNITRNNLGNMGPDHGKEGLVYSGEDSITKETIFLHVHAKSAYQPENPSENGFHGRYASINLKGGESVDLLFQLFDKDMNPKTVDKAYFTFFDLDTGIDGETTEFVKVKTYTKAIFQSESELKETHFGSGYSQFNASTEGSGEDNPEDPSMLTTQQKNRAVSFEFDQFQTAFVTLGSSAGPLPRWFLFVARPSLLCATLKGEADADNIVVEHGKAHTSYQPAATVIATTQPTTAEPTTTELATTTAAETTTKELEISAKMKTVEKVEQCCLLPGVLCGEQKWWLWCHR